MKIIRGLMRNAPGATIGFTIGGSIATVLGIVATVVAAPVIPLVIGAVAVGMGGLMGFMTDDDSSADIYVSNGKLNWKHGGTSHLIGKNADLTKIYKLQQWIDQKTRKYHHLSVLPIKLHNQILKNIHDIQPVIQRVQAYNGCNAVPYVSFSRGFYNAEGSFAIETIANVEVCPQAGSAIDAPRKVAMLSAPISAEGIEQQKQYAELSQQFTELANQLKGIQNLPEEVQALIKRVDNMQQVQTGPALTIHKKAK